MVTMLKEYFHDWKEYIYIITKEDKERCYLISKSSLGRISKDSKYEIVSVDPEYVKLSTLCEKFKKANITKIKLKIVDIKKLFYSESELRTENLKELLKSLD